MNYRSLGKALPFLAAFINRSTEYQKTSAIARAHTRYTDTFASVTEDVGQQIWVENYLSKLESGVK